MTATPMPAADQVRVSVLVRVPVEAAFRAFTEDINLWWRRGVKYRVFGGERGIIHLEPWVNGRVFESFEQGESERAFQTGVVLVWDPPHRLVFEWRAVNFAPSEKTEVEVEFAASASDPAAATLVTVSHRGWSKLRDDHPVRHGHDARAFLRTMGPWWGELMSSLREHVKQNP